jgi:hypothetical protein
VAKNKEPKVKKERFKTLKQIGQTYSITRKTDKALPLIILATLIGTTVPLVLIAQFAFESSFFSINHYNFGSINWFTYNCLCFW